MTLLLPCQSVTDVIEGRIDVTRYRSLVEFDSFENTLKNCNGEDEVDIFIKGFCKTIEDIISLSKSMETALTELNNIEKSHLHPVEWIYEGRHTISSILECLNILDISMNKTLRAIEKTDVSEKHIYLLDNLQSLCDQSLTLKSLTHNWRSQLDIANQYFEIKDSVIDSVEFEIDKITAIMDSNINISDHKNDQLQIEKMSFQDIRGKLRECELLSESSTERFIPLNTNDYQIFNTLIECDKKLLPVTAAMKFIPSTIEVLLHSASTNYPDLVIELADKYSKNINNILRIKEKMDYTKNNFITSRLNCGFSRILALIELEFRKEKQDEDLLYEMLITLNSLKQKSDLTNNQKIRYKSIYDSLSDIQNKLSNKTLDVRKTPIQSSRRVFSTPLANQFNFQVVSSPLSPPVALKSVKRVESIDVIAEPKLFAEELKKVQAIRFNAVAAAKKKKLGQEADTMFHNDRVPEIVDSLSFLKINGSINTDYSSPETVYRKSLSDMPCPFISPSHRKNITRVNTPPTTPRMTPNTMKYIPLPTSTNIERQKVMNTLAYDRSTKIETTSKNTKSSYKQKNENISPGSKSRIPLPISEKSRKEILRSTSRGTSRSPLKIVEVLEKGSTMKIKDSCLQLRSESRLSQLANAISAKNGTESPVCRTTSNLPYGKLLIPKVRGAKCKGSKIPNLQSRISTL